MRADPAISISWGELWDRITILRLKEAALGTREGAAPVREELSDLMALWAEVADAAPGRSLDELAEVNAALWAVEDDLREKEDAGDFGAAFVSAARSVYRLNDRRSALKRQINDALGSVRAEVKAYKGA